MVGREVKTADFNGWLLNRILRDRGTPVYTIHAEVEGCAYHLDFVDLLKRAAREGITFCPLSELLPATQDALPLGKLYEDILPGVKAGLVANNA